MPRYELGGDVWQIVQAGKQLTITSGGKPSVRTFLTPEQASAQLDKLVAEHVAAGYQLALRDPRHPALERAIADDPDARESYAVYGDWLESQGDPRGKLIALQLAAEASTEPALLMTASRKQLGAYAFYFLGELEEIRGVRSQWAARAGGPREVSDDEVFEWRSGYIRRATLHGMHQRPMNAALLALLQHPSGRFLVELTLDVLAFHAGDDPPVLDVLVAHAPASLRALRLSGAAQLDLSALWVAVSRLRRLSLSGRALAIGELALPRLEQLVIVDTEMPSATARMLARTEFPVLQRLELDFGGVFMTGDASIDDVFAILERKDLPHLAQLGIRHTRYIRELVHELAASPIAGQLAILDLSNNHMSDVHAHALAGHARKFPRLTHLDVSNNELSPGTLDVLRALWPNLRALAQQI